MQTSTCLMDHIEADVIDKTDIEQTDDYRYGETVITWRTRRHIRHRKYTDELSILDDLKIQNILYKRDLHESKIRVALNEPKIIIRQKHSDGLLFTKPKCYTKSMTPIVYEQKDEHPEVVMYEDVLPHSLAASYISSIPDNELTDQNVELEVVTCDLTYEVVSSQRNMWKMND